MNQYTSHELGLNLGWRQLNKLHKDASMAIRESAGHSFKNSIASKFVYDLRNHPFLPTKGAIFRLDNV
jgi:outer membrane protein insertion porin family